MGWLVTFLILGFAAAIYQARLDAAQGTYRQTSWRGVQLDVFDSKRPIRPVVGN